MDELKVRLLRAAVYKAMESIIKTGYRKDRAEVTDLMLAEGVQQQHALLDGVIVGSASITKARTEARVIDRGAFLAWVKEQEPSAIVTIPTYQSVAPGVEAAVLKRVLDTGEDIPGVEVGMSEPFVSMRGVDPGGLLKALGPVRLADQMLALTEGAKDGQ